ncbi:hypothetical protein DPEC_G00196130 [Dallia pectoralis]|uniref:Uncharacterized protein n=1 Tax=Dallia pectoralis TaxID=75939 RepID=A0ACC2G7J7_DALPE|nr:hypothetical protein DPEC_G00196130 [Dallia pectoralis]
MQGLVRRRKNIFSIHFHKKTQQDSKQTTNPTTAERRKQLCTPLLLILPHAFQRSKSYCSPATTFLAKVPTPDYTSLRAESIGLWETQLDLNVNNLNVKTICSTVNKTGSTQVQRSLSTVK